MKDVCCVVYKKKINNKTIKCEEKCFCDSIKTVQHL